MFIIFLKKQNIFFLIVAIAFSLFLGFTKELQKPNDQTINTKLNSAQKQDYDYLCSLKSPSIEVSNTKICFTGGIEIEEFDQIDYLSTNNRKYDDYTISFDALYMSQIDLLFLDVYINDENGNNIGIEEIYGYSLINDEGNMDILYDFYGYTFYSSDFGTTETIENVVSHSICQSIIGDDLGGSIIYPILSVSNAIVGIDDAIVNAQNRFQPPDIFEDGPIEYIMYYSKLKIIKDDFLHNSNNNLNPEYRQPQGYIYSQSDSKWTNWKYGLGTISSSGCGIISMYNFLISTGYQPDLPTLIALTQLLNADVLYGKFGTNTYPPGTFFISSDVFESVFTNYVLPIAMSIIPNISLVIYNLGFSYIQSWWESWFGSIPSNQSIFTTALIETAFIDTIAVLEVFVEWYWRSLRNIVDVISIFGFNNIYTATSLMDLITNSIVSQYFIINIWNYVDANGLPILTGGSHSFFVIRHGNQFNAINKRTNKYGNDIYSSLSNLIDINSAKAQEKFISGIVMRQNI